MTKAGKTIIAAAALAAALPAQAADVYLVAEDYVLDLALPDGGTATVPMWGYWQADAATFPTVCPQAAAIPPEGSWPVLRLDDGALRVHLLNCLPEATSLSILGLLPPQVSVADVPTTAKSWIVGGAVQKAEARPGPDARLRSLVPETDPGSIGLYEWPAVHPGSFLMQSGSHMAVQVQMGLSAPVVSTDATGAPADVVFFFSEIDPDLHADVAAGTYGSTRTSTISYHPEYFLVNGAVYDAAAEVPVPIAVAEPSRLRFFNAGLETRVPTLVGSGEDMDLLAEDGRAYPYARRQYSVALSPGKTAEAAFTPELPGRYAVLDRTNAAVPGSRHGGNTLVMQAGATLAPVVADDDTYATDEDVALAVPVTEGVLANDTITVTENGVTTQEPLPADATALLVTDAAHGTLALAPDGSFTYAPVANFNRADPFTYRVRLADGSLSSVAQADIQVAPVNDPPIGVADHYSLVSGQTLSVDASNGVLANDFDVDGDTLTVLVDGAAVLPEGFSWNLLTATTSDGGFSYTAPAVETQTAFAFDYTLTDGTELVPVGVTLEVAPLLNQAPMAMDDSAQTLVDTPIAINVLANDTDSDGTLQPETVTIVQPPSRKGTVVVSATGTITYTPGKNFKGSEFFTYTVQDDDGAVSNEATVQVDVVRTLAASGNGG